MKIQEVILKAMAGKLKWWEAAEIIGVTDRTMRRWRQQYEEHGYSGLWITASSVRVRSGYRRPIWNGAAAVPRAVLRPQRAALSREAARGARDPVQLHVGEDHQVLFQARLKHPCAREGVLYFSRPGELGGHTKKMSRNEPF